MTSSEKYIRKFVILNNYSKHFNEENKRVKGYGIIEIREDKGKISLNVEGFKHHYKNKIYKLYFLSEADRGLIEIDAGPIRIRDDGKGQLEWKFNPQNLGNTGLPLEKFNTILIRLCNTDKQSDEEVIVPLAGYIDKKDRDILEITNRLKSNKNMNKPNKKNHNASNLNKPCDIEKEIFEEDIEKKDEENRKDKGYVENKEDELCKKDTKNGDVEKLTTDEKEKTEIIVEQKEEKQKQEQDEKLQSENYEEQNKNIKLEENNKQINKDKENNQSLVEPERKQPKSTCEKCKDTKYYNQLFNNVPYYGQNINQYNNQVVSYTLNVLKFFEEVEPLKEKLEGYSWWEIPYDRRNIYRGFLPYYNYVINVYQQYPFITRSVTCQGLIKKYKHYIFGIAKKEDKVKYYIYGIPGKFTKSEHPYNGLTGFTTWYQSINNTNEKNGYWLLYIDAVSGKIITPKKPMIPY